MKEEQINEYLSYSEACKEALIPGYKTDWITETSDSDSDSSSDDDSVILKVLNLSGSNVPDEVLYFEEGMIWREWLASDYNTTTFSATGDNIGNNNYVIYDESGQVSPDDLMSADKEYYTDD